MGTPCASNGSDSIRQFIGGQRQSPFGCQLLISGLLPANHLTQIRRDLCSLHFAFFEQAFIHRAQDLFLSLGKRYQSAQFESTFWIV